MEIIRYVNNIKIEQNDMKNIRICNPTILEILKKTQKRLQGEVSTMNIRTVK
jgi:hypothetical protein